MTNLDYFYMYIKYYFLHKKEHSSESDQEQKTIMSMNTMTNFDDFRTKIMSDAMKKASKEPKHESVPLGDITQEVALKYLSYGCNYKKHKGTPWSDVIENDYNYFKWVIVHAMNRDTKTWKVLSTFIDASELTPKTRVE